MHYGRHLFVSELDTESSKVHLFVWPWVHFCTKGCQPYVHFLTKGSQPWVQDGTSGQAALGPFSYEGLPALFTFLDQGQLALSTRWYFRAVSPKYISGSIILSIISWDNSIISKVNYLKCQLSHASIISRVLVPERWRSWSQSWLWSRTRSVMLMSTDADVRL